MKNQVQGEILSFALHTRKSRSRSVKAKKEIKEESDEWGSISDVRIREPILKSKRAKPKRKPKSKKDWVDEDDLDDFLDSNSSDESDDFESLY